MRAAHDDRAEFVFLSLWDSEDAVRAFAGDDLLRARYYPEDERYLLFLDPHVRHFEVTAASVDGIAEQARISF
jgi:heme-degrading monooxygenase HmoA